MDELEAEAEVNKCCRMFGFKPKMVEVTGASMGGFRSPLKCGNLNGFIPSDLNNEIFIKGK